MLAEALSQKPGHAGAIAFSRTGDPSSGDFNHAKLIRKFVDVPDVQRGRCGLNGRSNTRASPL